ncbi:carbonic anhydrase family protein [Pedobacter metabolipauper]|uniref:Carbonic anhydrase n=1 Tax=Pedobacter metabolipauper TaxID=425513 RepID=A0A4R6SYX5_9SPHI|nr:carbonic anhydrase family protein [Pedobacter metabolipauper]TDQ11252.1 carbonic anhydrase [Pedobacter metabolipauper]
MISEIYGEYAGLRIRQIPVIAGIIILISSCQNANTPVNTYGASADTVIELHQKPLREKVLTAAEQRALTPDLVIQRLKEGNKRYVENDLTARDHSVMVRNALKGQYPKAVVISCLDSRVPVADIFDKGIGDLFVGRVAGNFVNEDLLGSIEYGCKVSGAKLVLIIGHESCGAIKAAIDDVKMGNITAMLKKIKPAVAISRDFRGEKTAKNDKFVEYVAKNNVLQTIETIRAKSPILKEMEAKGEIKIVGAYYELSTGIVQFL